MSASERRLELFEDYQMVATKEFDANGIGGTCPCDGYWECAKAFPQMPPLSVGEPPPHLRAAVNALIDRAFPGGPRGELFAAPRTGAEYVAKLDLGGTTMWMPDDALADGAAVALRDAGRRLGLLDLSEVIAPATLQELLRGAHPDLLIHVMEDRTVFRGMRVTDNPRTPERECTVLEAREVDLDAGVGDEVFWPLPLPWGHLVLRWVG